VVFDAQYDEPLHVIDNYPCPCSGLADCAVPTLNKTVDESQVNLTSLGYNTWLPVRCWASLAFWRRDRRFCMRVCGGIAVVILRRLFYRTPLMALAPNLTKSIFN
jgi:hypothetical protein